MLLFLAVFVASNNTKQLSTSCFITKSCIKPKQFALSKAENYNDTKEWRAGGGKKEIEPERAREREMTISLQLVNNGQNNCCYFGLNNTKAKAKVAQWLSNCCRAFLIAPKSFKCATLCLRVCVCVCVGAFGCGRKLSITSSITLTHTSTQLCVCVCFELPSN